MWHFGTSALEVYLQSWEILELLGTEPAADGQFTRQCQQHPTYVRCIHGRQYHRCGRHGLHCIRNTAVPTRKHLVGTEIVAPGMVFAIVTHEYTTAQAGHDPFARVATHGAFEYTQHG